MQSYKMWHRGGEAVQILNVPCSVVSLFDNVDIMAAEAKSVGQEHFASDLFI